MQNARDTFLEQMKTRLADLNPSRTVVVHGATRPAIVVEENELVTEATPLDCFRLRWTAAAIATNGAMPTTTQRCEITYATTGTALNAGMDRGRTLAALDAELAAMVNTAPQRAMKQNYAAVGGPAAMDTSCGGATPPSAQPRRPAIASRASPPWTS